MAEHIFEYRPRKYDKCGYVINAKPPSIPKRYYHIDLPQDFGNHYHYFGEELDPRFLDPIIEELDVNVFVDADYGHDKMTGRFITCCLHWM